LEAELLIALKTGWTVEAIRRLPEWHFVWIADQLTELLDHE